MLVVRSDGALLYPNANAVKERVVRAPALVILRRSGVAERIRIAPTLDAAVRQVDVMPPSTGSVTPVT